MMKLDWLAARIAASPFNQWLDLRPLAIDEHGMTLEVTTRPEMLGNLATGAIHGGVIAALVDSSCTYAWLVRGGGRVSTIDLRTDFHRAMMPGTFTLRGDIVRAGRRIVTAEARIFDREDRLTASGRAVMMPVPDN